MESLKNGRNVCFTLKKKLGGTPFRGLNPDLIKCNLMLTNVLVVKHNMNANAPVRNYLLVNIISAMAEKAAFLISCFGVETSSSAQEGFGNHPCPAQSVNNKQANA